MARDTNQLTLSFLDTTSLSAGGLTLDAGYNRPPTPPSPATRQMMSPLLSAPRRPRSPPATSILPAIAVSRAAGKPAPPTISPACAWRSKSKKKNATPPKMSRKSSAASPALAPANSPTLSSAAPAKHLPPAGKTSATNWSSSYRATHSQASRVPLNTLTIPGICHQGDLERGPAHGLFRRPDPRARLRFGAILRPYARSPRRENQPHRIEADASTARIATLLYPNAWIRHEDFTKARLPQTYALALGNPPFSNRTVRADDPAGRHALSLHDYFIARSIERLKPGGLAAFVTSRWTMDKGDQKARAHIASMADLIGAIRLPEGAMKAAAGTEVVAESFSCRGDSPMILAAVILGTP